MKGVCGVGVSDSDVVGSREVVHFTFAIAYAHVTYERQQPSKPPTRRQQSTATHAQHRKETSERLKLQQRTACAHAVECVLLPFGRDERQRAPHEAERISVTSAVDGCRMLCVAGGRVRHVVRERELILQWNVSVRQLGPRHSNKQYCNNSKRRATTEGWRVDWSIRGWKKAQTAASCTLQDEAVM